jgi:hypothetical protein
MTAKKTIQTLIQQHLERRGQTIELLHQGHQDIIDHFWDSISSDYLLACAEDYPEADPRYRFDTEWEEFWNIVEKLYPQYILKPVCVKV